MKTRTKWGIGAIAAVILVPILLITVGVWVYINWIKDDPPPAFSLDDGTVAATNDPTDAPTTTTAPPATSTAPTAAGSTEATAASTGGAGELDGTWAIDAGSQVGYRVTEVLFGQDTEGVGRTSEISGSIEISGTQVTAASFTVQMGTLESDENRRDAQFNGRIMSTDEFPTATFELTSPIELGSIPADGEQIAVTATGELTLRGVTQPATFELQAQRTGDEIEIVGSTEVVFADYDIPQPDTGGITTQDHGTLELSLILTPDAG